MPTIIITEGHSYIVRYKIILNLQKTWTITPKTVQKCKPPLSNLDINPDSESGSSSKCNGLSLGLRHISGKNVMQTR